MHVVCLLLHSYSLPKAVAVLIIIVTKLPLCNLSCPSVSTCSTQQQMVYDTHVKLILCKIFEIMMIDSFICHHIIY